MIEKIKAAWNVLHAGEELANAATWKVRQNIVNSLSGAVLAVVALARAFGYELPVSDADAISIAGGIAAVVGLFNTYTTTATSAKIGLSNKPEASEPPQNVSGDGIDVLGI